MESTHGSDIRRELARLIVSRGWGLLELRPMQMSLEEIFLQLTTEEKAEGKSGEKSEEKSDDTSEERANA